jgi:adenosylcobinamide-phosphate synthase
MHPLDVLVAVALDAALGDPEWLPHPVRYIGRLINALERFTRRRWRNERVAGTLTILGVIGVTAGVVGGSLVVVGIFGCAWLMHVVVVAWTYLGLSARSLADEARRVQRDLGRGDLAAARCSVARIVGRDTQTLDAAGVSRAVIESVAENTVDGILTPLFFAALGGPVALWIFKAISTGDSMIGHKDERYLRFGTAAARLDDAANFVPARLAAFLFALAALFTGHHAADAWRVAWRDRGHHDSPNAGIPEGAMAGALRCRLGGAATYGGVAIDHPPFGAEYPPPEPWQIRSAIVMMWVVALLGTLLAASASAGVQVAQTYA